MSLHLCHTRTICTHLPCVTCYVLCYFVTNYCIYCRRLVSSCACTSITSTRALVYIVLYVLMQIYTNTVMHLIIYQFKCLLELNPLQMPIYTGTIYIERHRRKLRILCLLLFSYFCTVYSTSLVLLYILLWLCILWYIWTLDFGLWSLRSYPVNSL